MLFGMNQNNEKNNQKEEPLISRYHTSMPLTVRNPLNNEIIVGEVEFFLLKPGETAMDKAIFIGTDFNYKSTYQLMTFDDRISLYKMDYQNSYFLDYMNIDAYISMQMDEFRMYFKMENIDNYWNLPNASFVKNYPTSPVIMRLGLTWDFFN